MSNTPDYKIHWAKVGSTWGHQDQDGLHVGHMNISGTFSYGLLHRVGTWISNYIHIKQWYVITHPCPNFHIGVVKPLLI